MTKAERKSCTAVDCGFETNKEYFDERLSVYRKHRDDFAKNGNALWTLHDSARKTLMRLKEKGIGMIILDECHHLLHHWGRVLTELKEFFDDPIVLGLTATPPDFSTVPNRYHEFFGEIDYEVPIPALVRDANLAPYQDLCGLRNMNSSTSLKLMMNSMKFLLNWNCCHPA